MGDASLILLILTLILALAYSYSNGLNDAANALAAVIATRALSPFPAVLLGGAMNLLGALTGTAVAKTIGKGIVNPELMTQTAVLSAILARKCESFACSRSSGSRSCSSRNFRCERRCDD